MFWPILCFNIWDYCFDLWDEWLDCLSGRVMVLDDFGCWYVVLDCDLLVFLWYFDVGFGFVG